VRTPWCIASTFNRQQNLLKMVATIPTSTQCWLLPYLHLLNTCPTILASTQRLSRHTYIYSRSVYIYSTPVPPYLHLLNAYCCHLKKRRPRRFPIHEIGRINGGRGFRTGRNVFQIDGNQFYDRKNKIPMKTPEFKRSKIGIIAEFRGIPSRFPNQADSQCPLQAPTLFKTFENWNY
jgi:hypothetical protein